MENIPKPTKSFTCPICKTPIPWSSISSTLGGKGIKNPGKAKGKDFKAMGIKSGEARRLKKEKIEFGYMDTVTVMDKTCEKCGELVHRNETCRKCGNKWSESSNNPTQSPV